MNRPDAAPETASETSADPPEGRSRLARLGLDRRSVLLLGGMGAALLASELAETVVATALPTIAADLGDVRLIALVTTVYLVASTVTLPAYGWAADRFGLRPVFALAVVLFAVGSVLGALAAGPATLVVGRLVQGAGTGGLLVLVQAQVATLVPLRQRTTVMSAVGGVFAAAVVVGPPLGGWLATGPGWRWAFWLNLPLAVVALVAALVLMPPGVPRASGPGGSDPRRGERQRLGSPAALLRRPQVALAATGGLLVGAASFGVLAYLPTYLQLALGFSPTRAGLLMLALFGGLGLTTVGAARLVRQGRPVRTLLVPGALGVAAGLALLGTATLADPGRGTSALAGTVPALVLLGAGIGCVWEVLVVVVQAAAPTVEVATATATNNLLREVGVVAGTAAVGAWVTARLGAGATPAAAFGPAFWAFVPVALLAAVLLSRVRGLGRS